MGGLSRDGRTGEVGGGGGKIEDEVTLVYALIEGRSYD